MAIDYSVFTAEPYDPCAALAALRPVYMQLLAEGGIKRIKFRDRDTEFHQADAAGLAAVIRQLESDCGLPSNRRNQAITAGYVPRCMSDPWRVR